MEDENASLKLTTVDLLIERFKHFSSASPSEQAKTIHGAILLLSVVRQNLVTNESIVLSVSEAQLSQMQAWCQSDDYAYKDWH